MKSYTWGIIGPGNIAHHFAEDIKLVEPMQEITAVLSDNEESANKFADEFRISKRFIDLDKFIRESGVDIAYIATPHPSHYEQIKACLANGIPVLCEKPIVLNTRQFDELIQLSVTKKTFLMEGMWVRFLPSFITLLKMVNEKVIGDVMRIKATMGFEAPYDESNRFYDPAKGGGSLLDLGVYCIFLSILLAGEPSMVKAFGKLSDKRIDEACGIILGYDSAYAILESSLLTAEKKPAEINGTEGMIKILDPWYEKSPGLAVEMKDGKKNKISLAWEGHGLQFEIKEVVDCVYRQKIESDLMHHSLSRKLLEIMDEIRSQTGVYYGEKEKTTIPNPATVN